MALVAAHLNAGHSGGDSVVIGTYSPSLIYAFKFGMSVELFMLHM